MKQKIFAYCNILYYNTLYYMLIEEDNMEIKTITIRLDSDLLKLLEKDADKYRTNRSEVIRQILLEKYRLIDKTVFGVKSSKPK